MDNGDPRSAALHVAHRQAMSDQGTFFLMLGTLITFAGIIFWVGFWEATVVLGGMVFLAGIVKQWSR